MRGGKLGLMLVFAGVVVAGTASATPTCTNTMILDPDGTGTVLKSQVTTGFCVQTQDKLYGNFNIASLPSNTVIQFNLNPIGNFDYHQISFSGAFTKGTTPAGHTYTWSYEIALAANAIPGTKITELDADFTQTAGGPSVLTDTTNVSGAGTISESKTGANATGNTTVLFGTLVTDMIVTGRLVDKGTISSVTNPIVEELPDVPEPASLLIVGGALAGFGALRRKRKD